MQFHKLQKSSSLQKFNKIKVYISRLCYISFTNLYQIQPHQIHEGSAPFHNPHTKKPMFFCQQNWGSQTISQEFQPAFSILLLRQSRLIRGGHLDTGNQPTERTPKPGVFNSSIATCNKGSVGIRSHSMFHGFLERWFFRISFTGGEKTQVLFC